jgi:hypothetical protein
LISPRDQAIDLSEKQWKAALARSNETWRKGDAERNEGKEPPKEPRGPEIRRILGDGYPEMDVPPSRDRGLLMLYLLDPDESGVDSLKGAAPVVAWALSFPSSVSERRVSNSKYMGNSVLWGDVNAWVD